MGEPSGYQTLSPLRELAKSLPQGGAGSSQLQEGPQEMPNI